VLGVGSAFSDYLIAAQWTPVLMQALLIGLLLLRPTGLAAGEAGGDSISNVDRDAVMSTAPGGRTRWSRGWVWGAAALALLVPAVFGVYWQTILTGIGVFVLLTLGLNVVLGLAGVLDLGYAVSFGIGAYVTATLTNRWAGIGAWMPQPVDFLFLLAVSMALAGLFGVLKGRMALRLRSDYLAVATLSLSLLAQQAIVNLNSVTGGSGGISALPPPHLLAYTLTHPTAQYYLVLGLVILVAVASQRLTRSRIGRAWLAGSEDETAAASAAVDVARYKTLALGLSAAIAGLAGALYASIFAYVSPELVDFRILAMLLAMVILGGAGSVPGAILGALIIAGYDRIAIPRLGELMEYFQPVNLSFGLAPDVRGLSYLSFGLALYLTVLLRARRRNGRRVSRT
jgi:branched-chain amino acid transport system permease protein